MCLLLRKPIVFRLALGIITVFILCLPEFFKIHEVNSVIMLCMDTCSSNNTTFPLCTFNNSYKRSVQQRRENQTILLKVIVNNSNFQNIPYICQSSWREQQSHPKQTECESKRDVNIDHQGSGSIAKKTKGSLEVKTEDVTYFYKYFNFTTVSKKEVEHNTNYLMEIHINNSIVGGGNSAEEQLNHSCLVAMMEDQNDCMNISLQLKSYMEYNKHRVATAVSTILRRKGSRHARRTVSATKIHHFPVVKTSNQQIPRPAQTTKILPVIPEQEHCHMDQL
ncbi:PREDICTED: transmembrane protein 156 isoform X2 [Corvus brachyrhynchos]|uniref:transmembrane protein 156 isoform X2 n=1 Tax=Corvus brachyrhynchos TaxID=85066 RepID=UPI00081677A6|nr:PREDICTED: transmembrane protein 156 isoform X2 [Corvus brachyrhynchos]